MFLKHMSAVFIPWQTIPPTVSPLGAVVLCASELMATSRHPCPRVGRSSFGSRHFHRVQSSIGLATRYCNAIGRQSRASGHALASRAANVSRNCRSRPIGQEKRSALPCIKRGRAARTMYRMQALQRICPCQVHCHSRTLIARHFLFIAFCFLKY